ncbi:unnamed protein product [Aphanomyces euteiches]|nr:hypothetical protein AeRB84_015260 [Aphanomyces euteiches]
MDNIGAAADLTSDTIVAACRDLGALLNLVSNLEGLGRTARSYHEAYPEGGSHEWEEMKRQRDESRAALEAVRQELQELRQQYERVPEGVDTVIRHAGGGNKSFECMGTNSTPQERGHTSADLRLKKP